MRSLASSNNIILISLEDNKLNNRHISNGKNSIATKWRRPMLKTKSARAHIFHAFNDFISCSSRWMRRDTILRGNVNIICFNVGTLHLFSAFIRPLDPSFHTHFEILMQAKQEYFKANKKLSPKYSVSTSCVLNVICFIRWVFFSRSTTNEKKNTQNYYQFELMKSV